MDTAGKSTGILGRPRNAHGRQTVAPGRPRERIRCKLCSRAGGALTHRFLLISIDFYRFLRISLDFFGFLWICVISMDLYGFRWISMDFYGFLWISMDFDGFQWISMDFKRTIPKPLEIQVFAGVQINDEKQP